MASSRRRRETESARRTPAHRPVRPAADFLRHGWIAPLAIVLATVLVYSNTLGASFQFDDAPNIVRNPWIRDLGNLWPPSGRRWVGMLTFALNYRLGGLDVLGYHLVNLAIHVVNALLVAGLAAATLRAPGLRGAATGPLLHRYLPVSAGLLFALHPLATQAVTYVVQRFTSLATLFFLLSLLLYLRVRTSIEDGGPKGRAALLYALAVLAAALAMKTKEIAVTLPLVATAGDLLLFPGGRRRLLLLPLAATALLVPLGIAHEGRGLAEALADPSDLAAETRDIPRSVYLLTQPRVIARYLRLLVLPIGQNLDYDFPLATSLGEPAVLLSLALLAAVVGAALVAFVRSRRAGRAAGVLAALGVGWFFATLSVESSVIPIRDVIFEHRTYLPLAGAALTLATLLIATIERWRPAREPGLRVVAALVVVATPLGAATHVRNRVWRDEVTLWTDVVAKSPNKGRPRLSLGYAYARRGRLDDAIREYREAIRLAPWLADAHNNLGAAHMAQGRVEEAMREYEEALRMDPRLAGAHNNLGAALLTRGDVPAAISSHLEALRLDPASSEARHNLGRAYEAAGRLEDAEREYAEAVRLDPRMADTRARLEAVRRARAGRAAPFPSGAGTPERDTAAAEARASVGIAHLGQGRLDDAARELREALRLDPGRAQTHFALGFVLAQQGRRAESVEAYRRAEEIEPSAESALNLAAALDDSGKDREAVPWYERFLARAAGREPERASQVRARIAQIQAQAGARQEGSSPARR